MDNISIYINPIVSNVDDRLCSQGFDKAIVERVSGGNIVYTWIRLNEWRKDIVQMHHPSKEPKWCEFSFIMYLYIDSKYHLLMAQNVATINGTERRYDFPTMFKNLKAKKIIKNVITDIDTGLSWFDHDREGCIKLIQSGRENIIINKDKDIYGKAIAMLSTRRSEK